MAICARADALIPAGAPRVAVTKAADDQPNGIEGVPTALAWLHPSCADFSAAARPGQVARSSPTQQQQL
jgi:hypothetical protein